jgi:hypothetical protein
MDYPTTHTEEKISWGVLEDHSVDGLDSLFYKIPLITAL